MPDTLNALLAAFLATVPGGLYTWSYEQQAGRWGATATDRLQRFLGASAFFIALQLWFIYEFYRRYVVTGVVQSGRPLPPAIWLVPVLFVVVPVLVGRYLGRAVFQKKKWASVFIGTSRAPRAWDYLFTSPGTNGWLRLRLKDGDRWVVGVWGISPTTGLKSFAAGYPEPQDLLLSDTALTDEDGSLLLDEDGKPVYTGAALLIRWDEVAYAEYVAG
jgi:hypothetical protein